MAYDIYECGGEVIDPVCDPCRDEEHGRVRGVAFIRKDAIASILADPTSVANWDEARVQGHLKVIPNTSGTFDGGSAIEAPGFGDADTKVVGFNFQLAYKDPSFKGNTPFYNSLMKSSNWHVAFRTETQLRISSTPVTVIPKSPVEEDKNSQVLWNVEVKFSQQLQPVPTDIPDGVFKCM